MGFVENYEINNYTEIVNFKETLLANLKKRFQVYFEDEELIVSTFLDYRFKSLAMFSEEEKSKIFKKIKLKMKNLPKKDVTLEIKKKMPIYQNMFVFLFLIQVYGESKHKRNRFRC
jgi:DNA-directed RNA polymerase subunit H (RpoH/RPB5)